MAHYDARDDKSLKRAWAELGDTQSFNDFLENVNDLDLKDKLRIVDQANVLIAELYAHLPLKEASHAVNPEQRLKLLRQRCADIEDTTFHTEMIEIFKGLRDAHTNYGLPRPYQGQFAFLPFLMEDYFEDDDRKFLVTRLLFRFSHSRFVPGVEITHWNGTPINRAVQLNADREEGSNTAARFAFGLAAMTVRSMGSSLPPDEEWVIVTFRKNNQEHEIVIPWRVWDTTTEPRPDLSDVNADEGIENESMISMCSRVRQTHAARKHLFARSVVETADRIASLTEAVYAADKEMGDSDISAIDQSVADLNTESVLPDVLQFAVYQNNGREFGYIRIRTFAHRNVPQFFNEFLRILSLMPGDGLILDVRGNGGGVILNGELLLQLFTPRKITPEPTQFINTPLTMQLCSAPQSGFDQAAANRLGLTLEQIKELENLRLEFAATWGDSIQQAIQTGAIHSKGAPITDADLANQFGQRYHGPVVLITDAQCYSTTDIFAAGFQDHEIGDIIGVDDNTGAGGANVFEHGGLLIPLMHDDDSKIKPLPTGTSMRVAIRRTLRVGPNAGQILEDLGVKPDIPYRMTRADLLESNIDLITFATEVLSEKTVRQLDINFESLQNDVLTLTATTKGIDRLDFYVDGRPTDTFDVSEGDNQLDVPAQPQPFSLEVKGFFEGELVGGRKFEL